jgi:hypothetical protein
MEEVGTGALLSEESFREQTGPSLVGFGHAEPGCAACSENTVETNYALGIPNRGAWMTQGMGFAGQSGTAGYTADGEIGLAVVTTFLPEAWNANGDYTEASNSASTRVFVELAELLAPGSTTSPQSAWTAHTDRLYVSRNTVKSQTIAIYRKLGTSSRSGAVEIAVAAGLVETTGVMIHRAGW